MVFKDLMRYTRMLRSKRARKLLGVLRNRLSRLVPEKALSKHIVLSESDLHDNKIVLTFDSGVVVEKVNWRGTITSKKKLQYKDFEKLL